MESRELVGIVMDQSERIGLLRANILQLENKLDQKKEVDSSPAISAFSIHDLLLEIVRLADGFGSKLEVIKVVRKLTGLGLKESKDLVEDLVKYRS